MQYGDAADAGAEGGAGAGGDGGLRGEAASKNVKLITNAFATGLLENAFDENITSSTLYSNPGTFNAQIRVWDASSNSKCTS